MRDPEVRLLEERACVAVRLTRPMAGIDVGALVGAHLESLAVRTVDLGLMIAGPPYVRYQQWGGALAVLELGFPTGPEPPATKLQSLDDADDGEPGRAMLPGGRALVVEHRGPYSSLSETWARASAWIDEHDVCAGGAPWESYVDNPERVAPEQLLTEVVWPLIGEN